MNLLSRHARVLVTGASACGVLALSTVALVAVTASSPKTAHHRAVASPAAAHAHVAPAVSAAHRPRVGRFLGIIPSVGHGVTPRKVSRPGAITANGTPPLVYHGGPVQHSSKEYAIYWAPPGYYIPPAYQSAINQYFSDTAKASYAATNAWDVGVEYYDNTGAGGTHRFAAYNIAWGGAAVVHDALPASGCANYTLADFNTTNVCLTDAQLRTEINKVRQAHAWPTGLGAEYFLFTPPLVGSCFDSTEADCYDGYSGGYCAYHSNIPAATNNARVLYANQPFAALSGCDNNEYPNGDDADPTINVMSHEANETITDPLGNAWYDSSGYENGDECAWNFIVTGNNGWGDFTQTVSANRYYTQPEWSNRRNTCLNANNWPQPTVSFAVSPNPPVHGSAATFTATATDSDDTAFSYAWNFGDGTIGAGKVVSHTFTTAGSKTVTLVVTDAHGDAKKVVATYTVS